MNLVFAALAGRYEEAFEQHHKNMAQAARETMKKLAAQIQIAARAEIARGGLGPRWQRGFKTFVFPRQPDGSINVTVRGFHRIGYANIFERGGSIRGRPLLWIPLPEAPKKINGRPTTAKAFAESVAPLHRIDRPGRPPLLAAYVNNAPSSGRQATVAQLRTGARNARRQDVRAAFGRAGGRRVVSVPMFVGVPSVKIRDRLNVSTVYDRARQALPDLYAAELERAEARD